jgi:hypothetical protein
MKYAEAWEELRDWLTSLGEFRGVVVREVLNKIDELEKEHE